MQNKDIIQYFIDGKPYYIVGRNSYTEQEYKAILMETIKKDEEYGYRDRMGGYYDKWYRYNRIDDGAAYDRGQNRATANPHCPDELHFIEVMEGAV